MHTIRRYDDKVEAAIRERFFYDGFNLRYKGTPHGSPIHKDYGEIAGAADDRGYRRVSIFKKKILVHRIIWFLVYDEWPDCVDHINEDKTDNSLENLRSCTRSENKRNVSKNGFKGCILRPSGRYEAYYGPNGKFKHIGVYDTLEEAAMAYDRVVIAEYGEFAKTNFKYPLDNLADTNLNERHAN